MNNSDTNSNFQSLFKFSNINEDDLKVIQQAEDQINEKGKNKVVLIAYDKSTQ